MTFIALDDEPLALALIERLARQTPDWQLLRTFADAATARTFLAHTPVDLILCDINMPDISGLDFVRDLPAEHPMVIFVTAYREHAVEGFDLDVVDYLVKPVHPTRFQKALQKAAELLALRQQAATVVPVGDAHFFVHSEYQEVRIDIPQIQYIESMGDYVKIHLAEADKPVLTLQRLKHLAEQLAPHGLRRIHRSYLINPVWATARQKARVRIGETWLPVSETYSDALDKL